MSSSNRRTAILMNAIEEGRVVQLGPDEFTLDGHNGRLSQSSLMRRLTSKTGTGTTHRFQKGRKNKRKSGRKNR